MPREQFAEIARNHLTEEKESCTKELETKIEILFSRGNVGNPRGVAAEDSQSRIHG